MALAEAHEDRYCEPEMWRLKGDLLLRCDGSNTIEAQSCFRRAIDIARERSAKSLELRARTSFARLLASQGSHREARDARGDLQLVH
jgi:hypothetical protein